MLFSSQLRKKLPGSLLVEAHSPVIPGFTQYFASAVADNTSVVAPLARRSLRASSHCDPEVSWLARRAEARGVDAIFCYCCIASTCASVSHL